jgi:hypothetical protein
MDWLYYYAPAEVAELADAHDSKSCALGHVGSIPTFGILFLLVTHPFGEFFLFNLKISLSALKKF